MHRHMQGIWGWVQTPTEDKHYFSEQTDLHPPYNVKITVVKHIAIYAE